MSVLILLLLVVGGLSVLTPHLSSAGMSTGGGASSATILNSATVGSYDLTVLKAPDASALDDWLSSNGFTGVPAEGATIVADYIKDGWVFVACKLRRADDGAKQLFLPHPLSMTFPSAKPIYPMRLTALSGGEVALQLFVIADGTASAEGLDLDHSRIIQTGQGYRPLIGHPNLVPLLWDNAVLSKLSATMRPADMKRDLAISLGPGEYYNRTIYSARGALETALSFVVPLCACAMLALVSLRLGRLRAGLSRASFAFTGLVPIAVAGVVAICIIYFALPKAHVDYTIGLRARFYPSVEISQYAEALKKANDGFPGRNVDEIKTIAARYMADQKVANYITRRAIREEDSPGNYVVFEDSTGVVLRAFDTRGIPLDTVLRGPEQPPEDKQLSCIDTFRG